MIKTRLKDKERNNAFIKAVRKHDLDTLVTKNCKKVFVVLHPESIGFDPKPLKTAGFGPLASYFGTTAPLRGKYTYDILV